MVSKSAILLTKKLLYVLKTPILAVYLAKNLLSYLLAIYI
jgi:hypothetical protein